MSNKANKLRSVERKLKKNTKSGRIPKPKKLKHKKIKKTEKIVKEEKIVLPEPPVCEESTEIVTETITETIYETEYTEEKKESVKKLILADLKTAYKNSSKSYDLCYEELETLHKEIEIKTAELDELKTKSSDSVEIKADKVEKRKAKRKEIATLTKKEIITNEKVLAVEKGADEFDYVIKFLTKEEMPIIRKKPRTNPVAISLTKEELDELLKRFLAKREKSVVKKEVPVTKTVTRVVKKVKQAEPSIKAKEEPPKVIVLNSDKTREPKKEITTFKRKPFYKKPLFICACVAIVVAIVALVIYNS